MKRILFFADASSIHTQRWVREIAARGFDCVVATRRPAEVPGARDVIAIRPGADAAGWFLALPEVTRVARRVAPQWVHGHYVTSYGLWAAASGLGRQVPVVLTAWGSDLLLTPREPGWRGGVMAALVGWSLRRAALVTADSQDVLAEVARYRTKARCEEVLWGADTERFKPGSPATGFEIASLRSWEPNYNIGTVLEAFARLREQRPQAGAVLHLLGGGPDEAALRAQADALGLGDSARFLGRVGDAAMVATLQRSRVSLSVPSSDATSVAMLESLACGLPVIASDLPANRAWIDPEWRVPPRDAAALATALVRLHDDPAAAQALGRRNRELALRRASRHAQMERMALLYDALRLKAPPPV
ncbi:MAG TPA: glycosyltransferase [Methylibium sp.]|nr:glycosyltransferase [Methylibium sp.]